MLLYFFIGTVQNKFKNMFSFNYSSWHANALKSWDARFPQNQLQLPMNKHWSNIIVIQLLKLCFCHFFIHYSYSNCLKTLKCIKIWMRIPVFSSLTCFIFLSGWAELIPISCFSCSCWESSVWVEPEHQLPRGTYSLCEYSPWWKLNQHCVCDPWFSPICCVSIQF